MAFYEKSKTEKLEKELFENPPAQFRGAPFWAWNTTLDEDELLWQIDRLKEMGFGGFFMHSRSGMATEYLSKEFMDLVHACVDHGKNIGMLSYLYDEDRWASGAAGGYVTKTREYRQKSIFLYRADPELMNSWFGPADRDLQLVTVYDIQFDEKDRLESYRIIEEQDKAAGEKWYLYTMEKPKLGWFNGYTYLDTMNGEAVDKFLDVTYEAYKKELGDDFGGQVPAIFTDEPNYGPVFMKAYARDGKEAELPWTDTFRETFKKSIGYDIIDHMPEIVWNLKGDVPSVVRYDYYRHATELFATSYCDRVGKWCQNHGIAFTGHVFNESDLHAQTIGVGEAMRQYKEFEIPGIDMLCNSREFATVKQAQSVAHQCGRAGMMSELYGVTNWDFDFRGHKFQGDWQAALGVTFRVPHLAWVSMQGSAKRDYPASISYQSCWFQEYGLIEDHFARLNTALTRGVPVVDVAVLHPIESYWITEGVREHTAAACSSMNERFLNMIQWLLRGQMDFDFVSESLLPEMYQPGDDGFQIGEMHYRTVFVPPLVTIRSTTIQALLEYIHKGGKVIVSGNVPTCVDGKVSDAAKELYALAEQISFSETDILSALEADRELAIYSQDGGQKRDLIYNLRQDGADRWLFIAHCDPTDRMDGRDCACDQIKIVVKGAYKPTLYDTMSGDIRDISWENRNGDTVFCVPCYPLDSFLFRLTPCTAVDMVGEDRLEVANAVTPDNEIRTEILVQMPDFVRYERKEPNVMVLDLCEWSLDGKTYQPREEILRIDKSIRQKLGYPMANGEDMQPWCIPSKEPSVFVYLRFKIYSEVEVPCSLGYERLRQVWMNGEEATVTEKGYFVDKSIHTMELPPLKKGQNELVLLAPISERVSIENFFLLGDFGVKAVGASTTVTKAPEEITFGSITAQGFPFYGAEVTYQIPFTCESGDLKITSDYYNGALISARLDGKEVGKIVLPPYTLAVPEVSEGEHLLELTLYASRINTFGALHACTPIFWKGPNMWYTEGSSWAYEYQLKDVGIMKKPVLTVSTNREG